MKKLSLSILFVISLLFPALALSVTIGTPANMVPPQYAPYAVDPSAADSGVTSTSHVTLLNLVTDLGTTKKQTIIFPHTGSGTTTAYVFSTSTDLSSYTNIKFQFEQGAQLEVATGSGVTLPSPSHIDASPSQQIKSGAGTLAFDTGDGTAYAEWWGIDGTADDIEIALACTSGAKNIELVAETYTCTGTITYTGDDVRLFSRRKSQITSSANEIIDLSGDRCTIEGIRFEHTSALSLGGTKYGVESHDNSYFTMRDCEVYKVATYGIFLEASHFATVDNVYIDGNQTSDPGAGAHAGITLQGSAKVHITNCNIRQVKDGVLGNTGTAFQIEGDASCGDSRYCSIDNNTFSDTWDHDVYMSSGRYNSITNNKSFNGGDILINSTGNVVKGNILRECISYGITVRNPQETVISDNVIEPDSTGGGITVTLHATDQQAMRGVVISNNTIKGGTYGVSLSDATINENIQDILIMGNTIADSTTYGIYFGPSTATTVERVQIVANIITADSGTPTQGIYVRYPDSVTISDNKIEGTFTNAGIYLRDITAAKVFNNTLSLTTCTYGFYLSSVTSFIAGSQLVDGTVTSIVGLASTTAANIVAQEAIVKIGTIAAGTSDERPVFKAGGKNGVQIIDCEIVNVAAVAAHADNYSVYQLLDKSADGSASNVITQISTDSDTDNVSLVAFDPTSMDAVDTVDTTHCKLAKGDVVSFKKTDGGTGTASDEMIIVIRYIEY